MFFDIFVQLGKIELRFRLWCKSGAIIQIIKQMLIGIRSGIRIFGESLKNAEIPLSGLRLVKASLNHRKLVVPGRRIATDPHVTAEQFGGLRQLFFLNAKVCQFEQGFREIRIRF